MVQDPNDDLAHVDFANPDQPLPGSIGPFLIRGRIGAGGMGVVLDAVMNSGEPVALKLIRPAGDPEYRQMLTGRLLREAKILTQLRHPGVVKLYDHGDLGGLLYLAMERVEGVTLQDIRARTSVEIGALISLAKQLASTLGALHDAGVVHRDIKPENVLIDRSGRAILTDFGIAWIHEGTGITKHGQLLGSAGYVAPECLEGHGATALSDQYALGRLLFEVSALKPPERIPRGTPVLVVFAMRLEIDWSRFPDDPPWPAMRKIIEKMTAKDPRDRFPDARACLDAVTELDRIYRSPGVAARGRALEKVVESAPPDDEKTPFIDASLANPTVFIPANTLHRFVNDLKLSPRSPWAPRDQEVDGWPPSRTPSPPSPGEQARAAPADAPPSPPPSPPSLRPPALPRAQSVRPVVTRSSPAPKVRTASELARPPAVGRASPRKGPGRRGHLLWIALLGVTVGVTSMECAFRWQIIPPVFTGGAVSAPQYQYRGENVPGSKQMKVAYGLLGASREETRAGAFSRAEQLLGHCVELADLPECHRRLALVLFVAGDPRADAHLRTFFGK